MQSLDLKSAMGMGKEKESLEGINYTIEQLREIAKEYKMEQSEYKNICNEMLRSKQRSIRYEQTKNAYEEKLK